MTPVTKPPGWVEVLAAVAVLEAWVRAQIAWLREKGIGDPETLDRLEDMLRAKERLVSTLMLVAVELQVLGAGEGPVEHDPVDFAYDPVHDPETPPGA